MKALTGPMLWTYRVSEFDMFPSKTMYVGMFAGGQVVKSWCQRAFRLEDGKGTRAYDFSETIPDIRAFRRRYDDALNSLTLTSEDRDAIVQQKIEIFEMNNKLIGELRQTTEYRRRVAIVVAFFLVVLLLLYALASALRS